MGENWTIGEYRAYMQSGMVPARQMTKRDVDVLKTQKEGTFQNTIITMALKYGWEVYHTYDSRMSQRGWPDLVLARYDQEGETAEVIIAELKAVTGKITPEQYWWLSALQHAGIECYLWNPMDIEFIEERLR